MSAKLPGRTISFNKIQTTYIAAFVVVLVLVLAIIWWYERVYVSPQNVFWGMVSSSLATPSVTKETVQNGGTTKIDEYAQMVFAPSPIVHDIRQITAPIDNSPLHLTLESVGTPTDDYQRYSFVQHTAGKTEADYNYLYKQWLHNGVAAQNANPKIFNGAVFGAVLFGDISQPARGQIVNLLHAAYSVDYGSLTTGSSNGRKIYTLNISINLQKYAKAASAYARDLGLPHSEQIDPANYQPSDSSKVLLTIDTLSHQLTKAVYQSSNQTEIYSGYGILAQVSPPKHVASPADFEKAINQISP